MWTLSLGAKWRAAISRGFAVRWHGVSRAQCRPASGPCPARPKSQHPSRGRRSAGLDSPATWVGADGTNDSYLTERHKRWRTDSYYGEFTDTSGCNYDHQQTWKQEGQLNCKTLCIILSPVRTGNEVDCCRNGATNRQQSRLSPIRSTLSSFGDKSATTWIRHLSRSTFWQIIHSSPRGVSRHCRQLGRLCRPNVERPFDFIIVVPGFKIVQQKT